MQAGENRRDGEAKARAVRAMAARVGGAEMPLEDQRPIVARYRSGSLHAASRGGVRGVIIGRERE